MHTIPAQKKKELPNATLWAQWLHEALSKITFESWQITRKGQETATARTTGDETIASLAQKIGLNSDNDEWKNWLTFSGTGNVKLANGSTKPFETLDVNDILAEKQTFTIPNTILTVYAGALGIVGSGTMFYDLEVAYLGAAGFKVQKATKLPGKNWAESYGSWLYSLSDSKELAGMCVGWSHGSESSAGKLTFSNFFGWDDSEILYSELKYDPTKPNTTNPKQTGTKYSLGLVVIKACYSEYAKTYVTSPNAVFWFTDKNNVLDPVYPVGAKFWGYYFNQSAYSKYLQGQTQSASLLWNVLKPGALGTNKRRMNNFLQDGFGGPYSF